MGRASRSKPARLAGKLIRIRNAFGLSQNEMIIHLGLTEKHIREEISAFERGIRQPPLSTLLAYARAAGVYVDALIDDDLDLPEKLPSTPKHEGVKRRAAAKIKGRR